VVGGFSACFNVGSFPLSYSKGLVQGGSIGGRVIDLKGRFQVTPSLIRTHNNLGWQNLTFCFSYRIPHETLRRKKKVDEGGKIFIF